MSYTLNDKIKNMTPYDPVSGEFDIRLDANESFITPPQEIIDEIKESVLKTNFNRYPDPMASKLCKLFGNYYGVDSELVTAGNGSDELISIIANSFLQKGDKAMVLAPDFSMYKFYLKLAECECVTYEKKEDFRVDFDNLIYAIQSREIKLIIFSNPCNPTSVGFEAKQMRKLIRSVDALVVLDEAYMDFYDQSLINEAADYDNLIILRTCSKAFGMAAIRLGFAVANKTLTNALRSTKSPYNVNSVTQAVGCVIFSHPDYLRDCVDKIKKSRDELYNKLTTLQRLNPGRIRVVEPVTNFVYVWQDNAGGLYNILKSHGIVVRNIGEYLRITAGTPDENNAVLKVIERCL